ncbi:helix-turn-helix transcriptional regulator [Streptomyces coeruleorubidus]|uniref:helix-turn-helix transcriptional regulator n=1 Tax=Streptomyces coeruleorubidus TaxID=116188 RepID=UPI00380F8675
MGEKSLFKVDLSILGLSAQQGDVYQYFLHHPGETQAQAEIRGISRPAVDSAVERLCQLGLLEVTEENEVFAIPPEVAIDRLTDLRLQQLHRELRGITQSHRLVGELRAAQRPGAFPTASIERLRDATAVRERIDRLTLLARREILSVQPSAVHGHSALLRALRRGVRVRTVVASEALNQGPTLSRIRSLAQYGAEVGVVDRLDEHMLVYDGRIAVVAEDATDASHDVLVVQEGGLVKSVRALFDRVWDDARKPADVDHTVAVSAPTDDERQILTLMCQVSKDEAGARTMGVSVRTYRRRIAELLAALGAGNRAQAALIARERGWI